MNLISNAYRSGKYLSIVVSLCQLCLRFHEDNMMTTCGMCIHEINNKPPYSCRLILCVSNYGTYAEMPFFIILCNCNCVQHHSF